MTSPSEENASRGSTSSEKQLLYNGKEMEIIFFEQQRVPAVCGPWKPPRGLGDCTCSNWKTLIGRRQRSPGVPGIACFPAWPVENIERFLSVPFLFTKIPRFLQNGACKSSPATHLDGAEVHGMFDDVVIIVKSQCVHVDGFVEGPGVAGVLLGQHVPNQAGAVAHLILRVGAETSTRPSDPQDHAYVMLGVWRVFLDQF